jgi:hypothetical protein
MLAYPKLVPQGAELKKKKMPSNKVLSLHLNRKELGVAAHTCLPNRSRKCKIKEQSRLAWAKITRAKRARGAAHAVTPG